MKPTRLGQPSVAAFYVRVLTDYCEAHGLRAEALFGELGLDARVLDRTDERLPYARFAQLCEHAAQRLNDPYLGLHLGQNMKPGYLGPHGFALIGCRNGRETMARSARYSMLVNDACHNEFEFREGRCIRYWRSNLPGNAPAGRLQDELNMAGWITLGRWLVGRSDVRPDWVSFRHAQPDDIREYQALFQCPLHFGAVDTAIAYDERYLDLPLPQANPQVRGMMDALCERLLQTLGTPVEPEWLIQCRRSIVKSFEQGVPELPQIAASLKLAPRLLRQRLAEQGINFRQLVDELRRELTLGYLKDPTLNLVEIAYLLGFSEQSAFQRAFKRWTGLTPGDYRKQQSQQAP